VNRFMSYAGPAALLLGLMAWSPVQGQAPRDERDYRQYFRKPTNPIEFWEAIQFELDVGRLDLAAQHIHNLVVSKSNADDLVQLHDKVGIAPFLRLRFVPRWDKDPQKDKLARDDVETLIEQITTAVKAKLTDPKRINTLVKNLYGEPEENAYSRIELAKSGAAVVPYLINELMARPEDERPVIIRSLSQFSQDTVPPLLAAFDIDNPLLRENIIDTLRMRKDFFQLRQAGIDVAPFLWPLASPRERSARLRQKAREALTLLYEVKSPDYLPRAQEALTQTAEKYYYHRVRFGDTGRVALWLWDGKKLVEDRTMTPARVEEYYGTRFTRQALDIAPRYEPAQIVLLSFLIERGYLPATAEHPLGDLKPSIKELLAKLNPDLVTAVLDRALRDERTPVILGAVWAQGHLGDVRALRPATHAEPALVRALFFGDRRVQLAAVEATLRIPEEPNGQVKAQIVDILKSILTPMTKVTGKPRILVALTDERFRNEVAHAVQDVGAEVVTAATGRQALLRLRGKADIDLIVLDSILPDPGLAPLLAQLRADRTVSRLPVLLAAVPETRRAHDLLERLQDVRRQIDNVNRELRPKAETQARQRRLTGLGQLGGAYDVQDVEDLRKRKTRLEDAYLALRERYDLEIQQREAELNRVAEKFRHVWVIPANQLNDPRLLQRRIAERVQQSGMAPLTATERKENVETALRWLSRMAAGEVKGYDLKPAQEAIVGVLEGPPVSDEATINAARIAETLPGPRVQRDLIELITSAKRPVPVRVAAAEALQRNIQRFGKPAVAQARSLRNALLADLSDPKLPPALRDPLARLVGTLRPGDQKTGERLRDFRP
jgi:CheY-like chemotaxis protein